MIGGYLRGPASAETCRRMSVSQRRRLGIPEGHVRIYGHHVPFEHSEPLRYWAYWIAWKLGRPEAERFVGEQVGKNYPDIAYTREQWGHKLGAAAVRELIRAIRKTVRYAN